MSAWHRGTVFTHFYPFHPSPSLLLCTFFENLASLSGRREHFRSIFHLRESRVSLCMDVRCLKWLMTLTFAAHFKTLAFPQSPHPPHHSHFLAHCTLFSAVSTSHTSKTHQQLWGGNLWLIKCVKINVPSASAATAHFISRHTCLEIPQPPVQTRLPL